MFGPQYAGIPRSWQPPSVRAVVAVAAVDGDRTSVQLTWTGLPCQTLHRHSIEPGGITMALLQPVCEGDRFPRDLVLVLTSDGPVDPATLAVTSSVGE